MHARVEGAAWEWDAAIAIDAVVVVILFELIAVGIWSSFSKSLLRTWLRERLMRRFRLVRLRSRNGFNDEDDDERNSGTDDDGESSVDTERGGEEEEEEVFVSGFIVDLDLS